MKTRILSSLTAVLGLSIATPSFAEGMGIGVGAGLAYPTTNHSLFINPAGLLDSPKISLQGSYLLESKDAHASLTSGMGSLGLGAGFRQFGNSHIDEIGMAVKFSSFSLGVVGQMLEFDSDSLDVDAALNFDLQRFRLAVVARGVNDGLSRLDAGIGLRISSVLLGFDVKKPMTDGAGDLMYFDASLSAMVSKIWAGVGYTFAYDGGIEGGDVHAGLSLEVSNGLWAEAFYNPAYNEWHAEKAVVGIRAIF